MLSCVQCELDSQLPIQQPNSAGSMLVKRTKWSVWFLQNLYNEYRVWQQGGQRGQEQGAINRFAEEVPEVFKQHAGIVPYAVFNQHRYALELVICECS